VSILTMVSLLLPLGQITGITASHSPSSVQEVSPATGSWNPDVGCAPMNVRITDITVNATGSTSFNSSPFSPGITTTVTGGVAKRWLTPGPTPPGWNSPGPACSIINKFGKNQTLFVEIDGVMRSGGVFQDNSTHYDATNGGGSYGGVVYNDFTFNIWDPSIVSNYTSSCTSAGDPTCYGRIHLEIDHDWQAAGYCGAGTACDPNALASQTASGSTLIDFQGFVYWDGPQVNSGGHSFSGWELHPLTAWRIHQTTPAPTFSFTPSSPNQDQSVSFAGTVSGGTWPYTYTWSFGDGGTGTGIAVTHTYSASGSYTVGLTVSDKFGATGSTFRTFIVGPDFGVSSSPSSLTIRSGSSGKSTIKLSSINQFSGTVSLSTSVSPSGVTASLNTTSISLTSGGIGSSILTISSSTIGSYTVNVTGTSGALSHTITLTVIVVNPDFSLSSSPSSLTLQSTISGTSTITLASLSNFNGTVSLSRSVSSSALVASLSPSSLTLAAGASATSTLTVSSSTFATYNVTITGTNGTLTHSTVVTVTVVPSSVVVASDSAVGPSSLATAGGQKLIQDSAGKMIAVYVDSVGRIGLSYANSDPVSKGWSTPVKSSAPASAYAWPAAVSVTLTSLRIIAGGGSGPGVITDIPVTIMRDSQNNITGFSFGTAITVDESGLCRYPSAVLLHNGDILLAWAWQNATTTMVKSLRWDPSTGWTNLAGSSTTPDIVLLDSSSIQWFVPNIMERPDNHNVYLFANRFTTPSHNIGFIEASWNGSNWTWGVQNLTYETNSTDADDDFVGLAWDPVRSLVVVEYGITGTHAYGVFTLNAQDVKTHIDTPTLAVTNGRGWGGIAVQTTAGDYYLFLISTDVDVGSGPLGFIRMPSGGSWNATIIWLNTATDNQVTSLRTTGATPTFDLLYAEGTSAPATVKFVRLNPPNFSVTSNPASLAIEAGSSASSTIAVSSLYGFIGTVGLSTIVSPSGLAAFLSPATLALAAGGTAISTLTVNSTVSGNYTVTILSTSGSLHQSASLTVTVTNFTIAASPAAVTFSAGSSGSSTITLAPVNGFAGTVTLAVTTNSTSLSCNLSSGNIIGGSGTSLLSCTSSLAANYLATVTGTNGTLHHSTTVTYHVQNFAMTASPTSITMNAVVTGNTTITVTPVNGFTGIVTLTLTTNSTNLSCNLSSVNLTGGSGSSTLSCSSSVAANYVATVTGTNGTLSQTATVTYHVRDFTVTASPTTMTQVVGAAGSSTVSVAPVNGFSANVALTYSATAGLSGCTGPAGAALATTTFTLTLSATIAADYTCQVSGSASGFTRTGTVTVNFQDFNVTSNPTTVTVNTGVVGSSTIGVSPLNGFAATVTLAVTTNSTGLSCSLSSTSLIGGSGTSALSCTGIVAGNYLATFSGSNGTLTHSAIVTYHIEDFALTASPASVTVNAGSSGNSTISITGVNGFANIVSFTTNSTACTVSPTSVTGSGSSVLSCTFTFALTVHVAITATSGSLSHSTTLTYAVQDFAVTASPTTVFTTAGAAGNSTMTIVPVNGFTGIVALTSSVSPPTGLTCTLNPPSITLGGGQNSTLSCAGTAGSYTVTLTATSDGLKHTSTLTYTVTDFTMTASPTSVNVVAGSVANSTIAIIASNGFAGIVNLSTNSTACTLTPSSLTVSGNATVLCNESIAGNYTVAITGTSGTLSHTAIILVTVQPGSGSVGGMVLSIDKLGLLIQFLPRTGPILVIVAAAIIALRRKSKKA
jgi:PKD repeat protein